MNHPNKPFKTYTRSDWETYYADRQNFGQIFQDLELLKVTEHLSTSQKLQLECITDRITDLMQR